MARHPRWVDALIAAAILTASLASVPATPEGQGISLGPPTAESVVLLVIGCGALFWRRTHPVTVWLVSLAATLAPLLTGTVGRGLPATVAALYALAAYGTRRLAVTGAVVTMLAALVLVSRANVLSASDPVSYAVVAWCGMAAALGDAVRSNRAVLAAAIDRARRAEQSREEEAQRRVAEERLRISRELHDVVAHHIAVVNVQAGVAEHLAGSDPDRAVEAMRQVRAASSQALAEMGGLVGLLRTTEDGPELEPAPGPGELPRLIEGLREAGEAVTWRHSGPDIDVAPAAELHLYRIVQEALTNAARHGTGPIELVTRQEPEQLEVEVSNRVAPAPVGDAGADDHRDSADGVHGTGHGLIGMRERVALVGGDLQVDSGPNGRFTLRVRLPSSTALRDETCAQVTGPTGLTGLTGPVSA
ncbi:sensor histidine kinase [Humibacillus xanthopallidus]|uniref:histidine kinase n=1 Tax=Humibacillus xanthopallidus TaxID=412689 RepID=A0A543I111_9MICO|nr:sensor histidine kinase [Humibacillus xanthopallidus]TQM64286.1 signal transduction histidine kinase [Humibacillus xanthopallidus]